LTQELFHPGQNPFFSETRCKGFVCASRKGQNVRM
jgi:hypothetical protein